MITPHGLSRLQWVHAARDVRSAEAQKWFDQGIQLLYGYNHDEAIRSFEKAAERSVLCDGLVGICLCPRPAHQ